MVIIVRPCGRRQARRRRLWNLLAKHLCMPTVTVPLWRRQSLISTVLNAGANGVSFFVPGSAVQIEIKAGSDCRVRVCVSVCVP